MVDMAEISLAGSLDTTPPRATNGHAAKPAGKHDNVPLRVGDITALARALVPFVRECISEATAPLLARIAELEARLEAKALTNNGEARQPLYDAGTWNVTRTFLPGDVATYIGTLCREQNSNTRPGKSSAWRLMEKSHR